MAIMLTLFRSCTLSGLFLIFLIAPTLGADSSHGLDGSQLSMIWVLPFAGILLSIALFPLFANDFWHHHFGKISAAWALLFVGPALVQFGGGIVTYEILHVYLLEYIPFIILLFALFTIAGGVRITGTLQGSPAINTLILFIGTVLASWMGTTGAAMLLIRPLIKANAWRNNQAHTMVFFIFLVANIGGALTPLGDPPLFLGFLQGVSFFWTTTHLFGEMVFLSVSLLTIYYILDSYLIKQETSTPPSTDGDEPLGIEGGFNLLLLLGVVAAVLFSGFVKLGHFEIYHIRINYENLVRDTTLLLLSGLSWKLTDLESRKKNGFNWFPIQEVGKLFAGIFVTIIPAIAILKAGTQGSLSFVVDLVFDQAGTPNNHMFFWITGFLSAFLDNAPTYLVFFNTAGGNAVHLMNDIPLTLAAISSGAVFMGAMTYIGNAPNFMVKAIAESSDIKMPSFLGFMVWSCGILVPLYIVLMYIFL